MKATAVIGANWGDEGKGVVTDHIATPRSMVVRYNGGAQASHTVVRAGKRHIFRHFGAGTLQGAATFLSHHFVSNPILFFQELLPLHELGVTPVVYVDPLSKMTTPWDMMINVLIEEKRGVNRHGSCGVGINETIQRHNDIPFCFLSCENAAAIADVIMNEWVPRRLRQLELEPSAVWMARLQSRAILGRYVEQCEAFQKVARADALGAAVAKQTSDQIVFEGAQGLLLDQDHRFFPHVTHSKTGLHNILPLCYQNGIRDLDVIYVTRAYATRHGAGPFPREVAGLAFEDHTNVPNASQGTMRFGYLDLDLLIESITNDLATQYRGMTTLAPKLAVTCLDQIAAEGLTAFWQNGKPHTTMWSEMIERICAAIGTQACLLGTGPTAANIREVAVNVMPGGWPDKTKGRTEGARVG